MPEDSALDALVVGAGFGGLHCLHLLRKNGFSAKLFEAGGGIGGTWFWNRYPGLRVDNEFPLYQYWDEELWDFDWTERFPSGVEIRRYFEHVDSKLNLSKDIKFNSRVTSAEFDESRHQWCVKTESGTLAWARNLLLCVGSTSKPYNPEFKGLNTFRGDIFHSSAWPKGKVDLSEKRVAIIGTGSSGVQLIQELGPKVKHLTVYQRTPNMALPMRQHRLDEENTEWKCPEKSEFPRIFRESFNTFTGSVVDLDFYPKNAIDASPDERRMLFEKLWNKGAFSFWIGNFHDILFNKDANDAAYDFWCQKVRARLEDPIKRDILAPLKPPHPFGTKRPSLEQSYYEVYNQKNVNIIDVRQSPILEITEKGVKTEKEGVAEVDIIILATGFDNLTGTILNIELKNGKGVSVQDYWKNGTSTYLGIAIATFPNCYFTYGPQGPTPFTSGITSATIQAEFIINLMNKMRQENSNKTVATEEAAQEWTKDLRDLWNKSLFLQTDSWFQGANIPGKRREPLAYVGGLPGYVKALNDCANHNYRGFI